MAEVLNLGNEVVKMRAEVKRVKVLVLRKLTRQIFALKKKKGSEADLERNQRRAARLLEEIRELKALVPDSVTKFALQSDISFEKVCQNKDSSLSERATARIATHPEFSKRIQKIKNAVEAFKAERTGKKKKGKKSDKQEKEVTHVSGDERGSDDDDDDNDDDPDDASISSEKVEKADEVKLKDATEQNKDPVTANESSSETGSTPAEVVRMRKEVKKLRVLIIRNLTQQITNLKKAKAEESEQKGNAECVARLQKEVQVLRTLLPDHVTTRALEGSIDMEKVFQDPESSAVERATAQIATHPRFVKKLQDVRQAIEEEKIKAVKDGEEKKEVSDVMNEDNGEVDEKVASDDDDNDDDENDDNNSNDDDDNNDDDDHDDDENDDNDNNDDDDHDDDDDNDDDPEGNDKKVKEVNPTLPVIPRSNVGKLSNDTKLTAAKSKAKEEELQKPARNTTNPKWSSKPAVKAVQSLPSKSKEEAAPPPPPPPLRQVSKPDAKKAENTKDREESDLSDSEEEKEYFDDSTEERFHKQSSYSEQSDDDDFFLCKVSKLKKKKKSDPAPRKEKTNNPDKTGEKDASKTPQFKMHSVFCSTLSKSSSSSQKGKHAGPKPQRFQNQKRSQSDKKPSWLKSQGARRDFTRHQMPGFRESSKQKGPGGDKTGRPAFERKNTPINNAGKRSQQVLHPSWEASRKRKEQQAQITAFQGKKIKFDDDDD